METKGQKTANRLIKETSPYLLQHAHNPVDWYSWGNEAFEKATQEDKPVFLSIGYSTCHWCHVMEKESFENEHIAGILNANFVSIKVDREERPDLDEVYMMAVQAMTGSGGWPLSVFLTPDKKPFYGGTYFPPRDMLGRPGFEHILLSIAEAWASRRDEVNNSANSITNILIPSQPDAAAEQLRPQVLDESYKYLSGSFDEQYGGFGISPKFPSPNFLFFLLSYWKRTGEQAALQMVTKTLDCMAGGGIYDHIGGGFHRYSTDRQWFLPHFEKMLYDQALISRCYILAWQITKNPEYARVAQETFDYVLRDMLDKGGGFYSGQDADSEGKEGLFYLWTPDEVEQVLGSDEGAIFNSYFDITEQGDMEGKNILSRKTPLDELNRLSEKDYKSIMEVIFKAQPKLLEKRNERVKPGRDEKIIVGWNALMISSLAYGGSALGQQKYIDAAVRAAGFILKTLIVNGRLMHYYRDGKVVEKAYLDDYAALTAAMISLYEATFDVEWLARACELSDKMIELFEDAEQGGFFLNASDSEKLIIAPKPVYDGALPSGNSMAAEVLARLGSMTDNSFYTDKAASTLKALSQNIIGSPTSLSYMLTALNFWFGPVRQIVVAPGSDTENKNRMLRLIHTTYLPNTVVLLHNNEAIEKISPFIKQQKAVENKTAAYICENYVCKRPVTEFAEFEKIIS